jgi:cation transport regulator
MYYSTLADLPDGVRDVLPRHAQEIYQAAANSATSEYADPAKRHDGETLDETVARVAWHAVESVYTKQPDGTWTVKD